jgi:hypothetical protein
MKCRPGGSGTVLLVSWKRGERGGVTLTFTSLRSPLCVSTGPVVVRLAEMAISRERERERSH